MTPEHERRQQARLPRDARRIGGAGPSASALAGSITRKTWANERHRVDAVRQRAHVGASRALGEPLRLERVGEVADEDRDRGARQHAAVDELGREPEDEAAQRVDEEQLNEIVEGEAEEPVDVAADDPTHGGRMPRRGTSVQTNELGRGLNPHPLHAPQGSGTLTAGAVTNSHTATRPFLQFCRTRHLSLVFAWLQQQALGTFYHSF